MARSAVNRGTTDRRIAHTTALSRFTAAGGMFPQQVSSDQQPSLSYTEGATSTDIRMGAIKRAFQSTELELPPSEKIQSLLVRDHPLTGELEWAPAFFRLSNIFSVYSSEQRALGQIIGYRLQREQRVRSFEDATSLKVDSLFDVVTASHVVCLGDWEPAIPADPRVVFTASTIPPNAGPSIFDVQMAAPYMPQAPASQIHPNHGAMAVAPGANIFPAQTAAQTVSQASATQIHPNHSAMVAAPRKIVTSNGQHRSSGYCVELSTAISSKVDLPKCEIGAIELLYIFPHHTQWPEVMLRLLRNGWEVGHIALAQLHGQNTLTEESLHRRDGALRHCAAKAGKVFFNDPNFKRTRDARMTTQVVTYSAAGYQPKKGQPETATLVEIGQTVKVWPSGQDRGVVTQAIEYALTNNLTHLTTADIPQLVAPQNFIMPSDAATADWDQRALTRFQNTVSSG